MKSEIYPMVHITKCVQIIVQSGRLLWIVQKWCIESVPSNDVCGTGSHVYSIRVAVVSVSVSFSYSSGYV